MIFLHYVLGDLLNVSYLIEPSVKANVSPVTLELKEKVSAQRLFQLVQQILNQHKVNIALNEQVFYVHPLAASGNKTNMAFGFGRKETDVPRVSSDIIQTSAIKIWHIDTFAQYYWLIGRCECWHRPSTRAINH